MHKRIWELDALRGLCILGMVIVHLVFDLVDLYGLINWEYPHWFQFVMNWGGVLFLLISGISVTLGSRCLRRGVLVLLAGLVCTAVTVGMYLLDLSGKSIIIYFGILQCLGVCMLLWPLFRKLPLWALAVVGVVLVAGGLILDNVPGTDVYWLMPFGLPWYGFASSDYFPLLPNLGFFLLGALLGKTLYRSKQSLLPQVNEQNPIIRFLRLCGRHSLWIYLLHQPILSGLCFLLTLLQTR